MGIPVYLCIKNHILPSFGRATSAIVASASVLISINRLQLRLVRNCVSGECQSDTDKQLASKGCDVLFYRQTGEPWIANVRAIRCPAPPEKTKQDEKTSQETSASNSEKKVISCLLSIANITAASCPTQGDITLGRVLGSGAFGTVHIGTIWLDPLPHLSIEFESKRD